MNILFVCTGNTCRSSMAEWLFKDIIAKYGLEDKINVESAGIFAIQGQPASPQAVEVMKKQSIDMTNHRSKQLTKEKIKKADLILTMTNSHKNAVISMDLKAADKTFKLNEYAYEDKERHTDIMDPFGASVEIYEKSFKEIEKALINIVEKLKANEFNNL